MNGDFAKRRMIQVPGSDSETPEPALWGRSVPARR
jgi:hypothetical protein